MRLRNPYIFKSSPLPPPPINAGDTTVNKQTKQILYSSHFIPLFKRCAGCMCTHTHKHATRLQPPTKHDSLGLWVWKQALPPLWLILWWQLSTPISFSSNSIWCTYPPPISLSSFGCYFFCSTQLAPHYMLSSCSSVKQAQWPSWPQKSLPLTLTIYEFIICLCCPI